MTIDEAIKILTPIIKDCSEYPHDDYYFALKLGIEALKRCKNFRDNSQTWGYLPLLGETKE